MGVWHGWEGSGEFFWGYLESGQLEIPVFHSSHVLATATLFLALYFLYYLLFTVNKPRVAGARGEFHSMVMESCPTLSAYYWPTFWAFHCHLNTIIRAVLQRPPSITYRRELFILSDGGEVALDWADPLEEQENVSHVLLILPGITGCSSDAYIKHLVQDGLMVGYRAIVFNQRGCGGVDLKTPRAYSGADVSDVKEVMNRIHTHYPQALVVGVGVSLGGMILTQYLHQMGKQCDMHAVMIVSSAWDPFKTQKSLENRLSNRILYSRFLSKTLRNLVRSIFPTPADHWKFELRHEVYVANFKIKDLLNLNNVTPEQLKQLPCNVDRALQCKTVSEFDTHVTVPIFGYSSLQEYYSACSNWDKVHRIRRPLLCITAADDPFVPKESLPFAEFESNPLAVMAVTTHGGHFGFLEGLLPTGHTWMNRVSREYLRAIKNYHI